jgi:asparagine synthase (glutamine-hydrolysing)
MCGIIVHAGNIHTFKVGKVEDYQAFSRGPDHFEKVEYEDLLRVMFFRLNIVGGETGMQPFVTDKVICCCNGEIYRYKEIITKYKLEVNNASDCAVIPALYEKYGLEVVLKEICNDEFAFVLYDKEKAKLYFARDTHGIKPLYFSSGVNGICITSTLLDNYNSYHLPLSTVKHVQCDRCYSYDVETKTLNARLKPKGVPKVDNLLLSLQTAVVKRMFQAERPVGFFLSGGLDSCAVVALALQYRKPNKPLHFFTCAFEEDASDVLQTKKFLSWVDTTYGVDSYKWHFVKFTYEEGFNVLESVVKALGTFDTTTVRASVPMYLLSKWISANTDVKVLLSGEGSDELFGGYMYFKYAPGTVEFYQETQKLLSELYMFDVLRADRCTASWGLEIRPPFLDGDFIETVRANKHFLQVEDGIDKRLTKPLLRNVLRNVLPESILLYRKEAFSDAVGLSWIVKLEEWCKKICGGVVIPKDGRNAVQHASYTALVLEQYYEKWFGMSNVDLIVPKLWLPNRDWVDVGYEPSARVLPNY